MGQPVTVIEKPSTTAGVVRFELNRTLSGMGHESFRSVAEAVGPTPSAEVARRLFDHGGVAAVHVYANVITVQLDEVGQQRVDIVLRLRPIGIAGEPHPLDRG